MNWLMGGVACLDKVDDAPRQIVRVAHADCLVHEVLCRLLLGEELPIDPDPNLTKCRVIMNGSR